MLREKVGFQLSVRAWSSLLSLFRRSGAPAEATRVTKPCIVAGCDGTMGFDYTEWPSYGTWICRRSPRVDPRRMETAFNFGASTLSSSGVNGVLLAPTSPAASAI